MGAIVTIQLEHLRDLLKDRKICHRARPLRPGVARPVGGYAQRLRRSAFLKRVIQRSVCRTRWLA